MDNLYIEDNAKVSDSAYSNICNNSQSRRSVHSGEPSAKRSKDKEIKQINLLRLDEPSDIVTEEKELPVKITAPVETIKEEAENVKFVPVMPQAKTGLELLEKPCVERNTSSKEVNSSNSSYLNSGYAGCALSSNGDGFSCVVSMHDGVVMYTTSSITTTLGYPKDMWIGRSFIDFVYARDRNTFASHISSGLSIPKTVNEPMAPNTVCTMVCRLRRYRSLSDGYAIKDRPVSFMPFLLKLSIKNISEKEEKVTYLVIQGTPFVSAFKLPNEVVEKPLQFVLRHAPNGNVEYIDPKAVSYLGYLPHDLEGKDALLLYHADDLAYLRRIYETIVKEGGDVPRCKPYRMMTQNGDFIKVATEWSSFINPWSKKLEFVSGKHHIIEGPKNPDVFKAPENKNQKITKEEKTKAQFLRDSIIRIMNDVLTKPAEVAKQQMTQRCQDLASFIENLTEEPVKSDKVLHVEVQEPDNSCYERDSVILGCISPHHDDTDSKSSVETTLSYNQLNYSLNLQRYFDSHQQNYCYEDYNTVTGENVLCLKSPKGKVSPITEKSLEYGELTRSEPGAESIGGGASDLVEDNPHIQLTKSLISKHNTEMEKELKMHREIKPTTKIERKKVIKENGLKKKEHLIRCNASFQPTYVINTEVDLEPHGMKRASKLAEADVSSYKHYCPTPRQSGWMQVTSAATAQPSTTVTTTVASGTWPSSGNNKDTFFFGFPPQMQIMGGLAGVVPLYYVPAALTIPITAEINTANTYTQFPHSQPHSHAMPYITEYGQPVYGSPFIYTSINPQVAYPHARNTTPTSYPPPAPAPLGLPNRNYVESSPSRTDSLQHTAKKSNDDRTDGESSYSSFYSSFFKTESGSADDSGDGNKSVKKTYCYESPQVKVARWKRDPPEQEQEQVRITSELIYKYQVPRNNLEVVLKADKLKLSTLQQPDLVNEQLGQLYIDQKLEGKSVKLNLEESITFSSSSEEETTDKAREIRRKRVHYSKLAILYEEEAPLPSPEAPAAPEKPPSSSI